MQRIPRDQAHVYALDGTLDPALRVAAGEPFAVETDDASSGLLTSGELAPTLENLPYARFSPARANPVGGPVYVEGVAARGRIRVEIDEITVADTGIWYNRPPHLAAARLAGMARGRRGIQRGHPARRRRGGDRAAALAARADDRNAGVRPEWEVHSTTAGQGPFGGNLDVGDYQAGAAVFLTSYH